MRLKRLNKKLNELTDELKNSQHASRGCGKTNTINTRLFYLIFSIRVVDEQITVIKQREMYKRLRNGR